MLRLLVTVNIVPTSPILVARMMEAILSPETSVNTTIIFLNFQEDGILQGGKKERAKNNVSSNLIVVPNSLIFYTLMLLILSSETLVFT
jgi:hypothetical protein